MHVQTKKARCVQRTKRCRCVERSVVDSGQITSSLAEYKNKWVACILHVDMQFKHVEAKMREKTFQSKLMAMFVWPQYSCSTKTHAAVHSRRAARSKSVYRQTCNKAVDVYKLFFRVLSLRCSASPCHF